MDIIQQITDINSVINDFVWVKIGLFLLIGAGILLTVGTKFFQVAHVRHWWQETIGSLFKSVSSACSPW